METFWVPACTPLPPSSRVGKGQKLSCSQMSNGVISHGHTITTPLTPKRTGFEKIFGMPNRRQRFRMVALADRAWELFHPSHFTFPDTLLHLPTLCTLCNSYCSNWVNVTKCSLEFCCLNKSNHAKEGAVRTLCVKLQNSYSVTAV